DSNDRSQTPLPLNDQERCEALLTHLNQLQSLQSNSPYLLRDLRSIAHARWKLAATLIGTQGVFAPDHPENTVTSSQTRTADPVRIQSEFRDDHSDCRNAGRSLSRSVQSLHNANAFPVALSAQGLVQGST